MATTDTSPRRPRRRWLRWVAVFVLLTVVLWLGLSYSVAYELTTRNRPLHGERLPEVEWGVLEPVTLQTADGETLGAWFVEGLPDQPAVLLLHGNGGCRSNLLAQAEWLASRGCSVFLVTLRAHGDSTGDYNDIGYSALHDVIAAVSWLRSRVAERPIVVWGQSVGGVAAVLAAKENGSSVDGYILECVYQDLATAVRNRLELALPGAVVSIAEVGLRLVAPLRVPNLAATSPCLAAASIPPETPVLLLAGGDDQRAKVAESAAIAERIGASAEVVVIERGGHLQLANVDAERYFAAVEQLLARVEKLKQ